LLPRDKAKVENGVLVVERWVIAALRNRRFFEIGELNQAIRELLVKLNNRPFRKREGSRASLFHAIDKPALSPLPSERFESILRNSLDLIPLEPVAGVTSAAPSNHDNIRGAAYFEGANHAE
jgi:hypothetical protein